MLSLCSVEGVVCRGRGRVGGLYNKPVTGSTLCRKQGQISRGGLASGTQTKDLGCFL